MNLESIALVLEQKGVGTRGQTLFVAEMPQECQLGVLLMDQGNPLDPYIHDYVRNGTFTVAVRGPDYVSAKTLAMQVYQACQSEIEVQLPGMLVKRMWPLEMPWPRQRSVAALWEFSVAVDITFVATP